MGNNPTSRALELLSLLQTHRLWSGLELAERLQVTERTVRRDVDRLRGLGYPVDASPGADGGYRLATGAVLPPLVLDDEEAVAVAVGLRVAANATIAGIEDTSLRAMAKIEQLLPDRLRRRVSALHNNVSTMHWDDGVDITVDLDALSVLASACRDHEEVRFDYRRKDGEDSRRLVEPHRMVTAGRRWYLVAWDLRRTDWRTFRVDRLSDARLAGARFVPKEIPGGDASAFVIASIGAMPRALEAAVTVGVPSSVVAEGARWIDHTVVEDRGASCAVRVRADTMGDLVMAVVRLGLLGSVVVAAPPDVGEAVRVVAGRLAQR